MIPAEQTITGTRDVVYDLVSVLYRALQGAEIYEKYAEDAFRAGNDEHAQYFREVRDDVTAPRGPGEGVARTDPGSRRLQG